MHVCIPNFLSFIWLWLCMLIFWYFHPPFNSGKKPNLYDTKQAASDSFLQLSWQNSKIRLPLTNNSIIEGQQKSIPTNEQFLFITSLPP